MEPDAKRTLRHEMRLVRRSVPDQAARSAAIVDHLGRSSLFAGARTVMLFDAVTGEPDLSALAVRLDARGVRVERPDPSRKAAHPVDPADVDVVVVPGLAFTADGRRLGQGGGWYDRFLAAVRPDAAVIGVCFAAQLLHDLPTEPHDVAVHHVVTEREAVSDTGRDARRRHGV